MKKLVLAAAILSVVFIFCGCGQEATFTVWNSGVNVGAPGEWLHVIIEWEDGGSMSWYPQTRALTEADIDAFSSTTFKVKENNTVTIQGGGFSIKADSSGNTVLAAVDIGVNTATVYGGFLESAQWYCAIYEKACFIYKK